MVSLLVFAAILRTVGWSDWRASTTASLVATLNNYIINNLWTFRDNRRTGVSVLTGCLSYLLVALTGLGVTTTVYSFLAKETMHSRISHTLSPSMVLPALLFFQLVGTLLGAYLNFELNRRLTWRTPQVRVPEDLPNLDVSDETVG